MKKMVFRIQDWDKACEESIEDGTGFFIDTSIVYQNYLDSSDIENIKKVFSIPSIYSYRFGLSTQIDGSDPILKKTYTCKCHMTYGIENLGKACDHCSTLVQRSIPARRAWMDLQSNYVLHPFLCSILYTTKRELKVDKKTGSISMSENIYSEELEDIDELEVNLEENNKDDEENVESSKKKKTKKPKDKKDTHRLFDLITKKKLKYTWDDILFGGKLDDFMNEYFKGSKAFKLYETMKDRVFIHKILVMSYEYRPMKIGRILGIPDITQDAFNKKYMSISESIRYLLEGRNMLKSTKISLLVNIMKNLSLINTSLMSALSSSKKALIRGEIYSRRYYNSGRLVLEPIVDRNIHDLDVVQLPIDFFRGIFSQDILKILNEYPEIDGHQRSRLVNSDIVLTEEELDFIEHEIFPKVESPVVYINREPCIYVTSVLGMRVIGLTRRKYSTIGNELTIRVPFFILPAIAGDFDGDVISIITWPDPKDRRRILETLSPKKSIINTINVSYNSNLGQNNNTAVLLYRGYHKDAEIRPL